MCSIWKLTAAQNSMELTKTNRTKITDSVHSIQPAPSLTDIGRVQISKLDEFKICPPKVLTRICVLP